jgi:uncharacterized protein (DUF433 family)
MTGSGQAYLGLGLYTLPEAARFIGVPSRNLTRWAEGYAFQTRGKQRSAPAVIPRRLPELAEQRLLTFQEMVELKLVSTFRALGIPMQRIRAAADRFATVFGTDRPFALRAFHTDGKRIFAEGAVNSGPLAGCGFLEEAPRYQLVMEALAAPFFAKLDYDDQDLADEYWPLGREKGIVLDRRRALGKPIDHATGVPTWSLFEMRRAGETEEAVASWFGVSRTAVSAAVEYETLLLAA